MLVQHTMFVQLQNFLFGPKWLRLSLDLRRSKNARYALQNTAFCALFVKGTSRKRTHFDFKPKFKHPLNLEVSV